MLYLVALQRLSHARSSDTSKKKQHSSYHWGIRIPPGGTLCLITQRESNPCRASKRPGYFGVFPWALLRGKTGCTLGRNSTFGMVWHDPKGYIMAVQHLISSGLPEILWPSLSTAPGTVYITSAAVGQQAPVPNVLREITGGRQELQWLCTFFFFPACNHRGHWEAASTTLLRLFHAAVQLHSPLPLPWVSVLSVREVDMRLQDPQGTDSFCMPCSITEGPGSICLTPQG